MLRSVFSLIVLVGYASAQLSNGCLTALTYTIGNPASQLCLGGESALTTLLAALAASTSSIIPDINYWLTGLCNSPECSEDTLADVVHNITNGCLAELNLPAPTIANLTNTVEQLYPTARYIMCLEDVKTNTKCLTELLSNIQGIYGKITQNNFGDLVGSITASNLPFNITCSNCVEAIYVELNQSTASAFIAGGLGSTLKSQCGPSFIDGPIPTNIIESANDTIETSTPSASSNVFGGVSFLLHGIITGLVVISALLLP